MSAYTIKHDNKMDGSQILSSHTPHSSHGWKKATVLIFMLHLKGISLLLHSMKIWWQLEQINGGAMFNNRMTMFVSIIISMKSMTNIRWHNGSVFGNFHGVFLTWKGMTWDIFIQRAYAKRCFRKLTMSVVCGDRLRIEGRKGVGC